MALTVEQCDELIALAASKGLLLVVYQNRRYDADFITMKKLIDDLRGSINVPHLGRVALAVYLIKAGLSDEHIGQLFSSAPDYNADTTKYQVAYTRQKAYSMPSCSTMDSWGVCVANCRCFNPTKFKQAIHGRYAKESMSQTAHGEQGDSGAEVVKPTAIVDPHAEKNEPRS